MSTKATQEKCNASKFKRMNYFHGMLLTEQDFSDEQTYIREKLKLQNQLNGSGVVWGLILKKDCVKVDSEKIIKIFISGGLALDCAGNEIVVCEDYLVPLDEKIAELRRFGHLKRVEECQPPKFEGPKLFVGIKYCECKSDPAEQLTSECADDRLRPQYSRVREGFQVQLFTLEELPGCLRHNGDVPMHSSSHPCPDCKGLYPCTEEEQIIILGWIEDYDASTGNPDHKDAKISLSENYPPSPEYLRESMWAYRSWEVRKLSMLRSVLQEAKWIDVSVLIGEGTTKIGERLENMALKLGQIYKSDSIPDLQEFLTKSKCAQPWAEPQSVIDVIADKSGKCIIFLLVNPPQN